MTLALATPAVGLAKPGKGPGATAQAAGPQSWFRDVMRLAGAEPFQASAAPIVVAVLDTGLEVSALGPATPQAGPGAILPGWDFVNGDADPADDDGHGTLMASLIAGAHGRPGVAPGVALLPVKVLGHDRRGTEADLAEGIAFATAAGADVISMSLAFPEGFVPGAALARAIAEADAAGVVLVAAAGNHASAEIAYPAAFGPVLAVGASALARPYPHANESAAPHKAERSSYSGFGAGLDALTPGGALTTDLNRDGFPDGLLAFGPGGPELVAGTSASAATAAGLAARLLAAGADPEEVRVLLQAAATEVGGPDFDTFEGAGHLDLEAALSRLAAGKVPVAETRYVNPVASLVEGPEGRRVVVVIEVLDAANQPVAGVEVLGHVRGAVRHDLRATTDPAGRALFVTRPVRGGTTFEIGVDQVVETVAVPGAAPVRLATPPRAFARFDLQSLEVLASVGAYDDGSGGTGLEPSPFVFYLPWLQLRPYALAIASTAPVMHDAADPQAPAEGAPADLADHQPVDSVMARTFAGPLTSAPTLLVLDRALLADCDLAAELTPVASGGTGLEPSPFRLSLLAYEPTFMFQPILVRATTAGAEIVSPDGTVTTLALLGGGTPALVAFGPGFGCPMVPAMLSRSELLPPALVAAGASHHEDGARFEVLAVSSGAGSMAAGPAGVSPFASGPVARAPLAAWAGSPMATGPTALLVGATEGQLPVTLSPSAP